MKQLATQSLHLANAWPTLTERARTALAGMHEHYRREFAKWRKHPEPQSVAHTVHGLVDEACEAQAKVTPDTHAQIRCTRGCAHCCKQNVTISAPEAKLLLLVAKDTGVPIDWDLLDRQSRFAGASHWHEQPVADRRCVFLDENDECRVYEHRPSACRKHFVVSDPAHCDIEKFPGTQTLNWVSLEAEVIFSAALSTFESRSMPIMLKRVKQ